MKTGGYDHFTEPRIKHLELIQSVIARLGNDGFVVKGWALTLAGAFLGFAAKDHDAWLAAEGLLPTLLFWGLDAYFLRSERLFRKLYDHVREGRDGTGAFFMGATSPEFVARLSQSEQDELSTWKTARRPAVQNYYLAIVVAIALMWLGIVVTPRPATVTAPPRATATVPAAAPVTSTAPVPARPPTATAR